MFGLFSPKPDAKTQKMYAKQSEQISQVCFYIFQKHSCPPVDGTELNDLTVEENRVRVVNRVEVFCQKIHPMPNEERQKVLVAMAQERAQNAKSASPEENDALLLINIINMTDTIFRHYYEFYPKYDPLHKMVNNLAKIVAPAMTVVFEKRIPDMAGKTFPHFRKVMDQCWAEYF